MRTFNSNAFRSSIAAVFAVTVISATAWSLESYLGYLQRDSNQVTAQQMDSATREGQYG
jgi:hypothetical protein